MAKKTQPRTDGKDTRRALRVLSERELESAVGGYKPGQYVSSSGGGGVVGT